MQLIRERIAEQILIYPKNTESLPLFKHCTGGREHVEEQEFQNNVAFLLDIHCKGSYVIKDKKIEEEDKSLNAWSIIEYEDCPHIITSFENVLDEARLAPWFAPIGREYVRSIMPLGDTIPRINIPRMSIENYKVLLKW